MEIAIMALLGVALAFLLVRYGPVAQKRKRNPDAGLQGNRVGDGLRRLKQNKQKYAEMTGQLLAETPDENLIEVVLANLWAKMRPDMADALTVIEGQSVGRRYVFAVYAVTGGVKQAGFEKLKDCPDRVLLPVALEALQAMELPRSAALLHSAMETDEADSLNVRYTDAFDEEDGKGRMVEYIRAHTEDFIDS